MVLVLDKKQISFLTFCPDKQELPVCFRMVFRKMFTCDEILNLRKPKKGQQIQKLVFSIEATFHMWNELQNSPLDWITVANFNKNFEKMERIAYTLRDDAKRNE